MSTTMETFTAEARCPTRFSTYSMAPTLTPSIAPSRLSQISTSTSSSSTTTHLKSDQLAEKPKASPMATDLKHLQHSFARMDDPELQRQRYVASETKRDEISKLALGAKIDKALGRRMTGQDATFKVKVEKKLEALVFVEDDNAEKLDGPSCSAPGPSQLQQDEFVYDEHTIGIAR